MNWHSLWQTTIHLKFAKATIQLSFPQQKYKVMDKIIISVKGTEDLQGKKDSHTVEDS